MKMKNKQSTSHKKGPVVTTIIIIVALLGIGGFIAYYFTHNSLQTSSPVNLNPPTKQEQAAGNQTKSSNANSNSTDATKNSSSSSSTDSSNTSVQLTASSQSGSVYQLRYLINSVVANATCTLTLTSGSRTVTKTASVQALAQSSTCEGFNISTSELSPGSWTATMVVTGNNINASVTNTIQVQ